MPVEYTQEDPEDPCCEGGYCDLLEGNTVDKGHVDQVRMGKLMPVWKVTVALL